MLAGSLYYFVSELGFSEKNCLWVIGSLTVLLSSIALIYAYRLIKTLTSSTYVHAVTIGFLGLTRSLIYMSTRISNDPLTASLAIISLFYIIKSYQTQFRCYFAKALLFTSLVFLSKISSLGLIKNSKYWLNG